MGKRWSDTAALSYWVTQVRSVGSGSDACRTIGCANNGVAMTRVCCLGVLRGATWPHRYAKSSVVWSTGQVCSCTSHWVAMTRYCCNGYSAATVLCRCILGAVEYAECVVRFGQLSPTNNFVSIAQETSISGTMRGSSPLKVSNYYKCL